VDDPFRPVSRARTGRGWHIDITFVANPAAISVLRGVEVPSQGGDTAFADLQALYNGLSAPLRGLVDGLKSIHVRDDAGNGVIRPPRYDGRPTGPFAALHPLVRVHPETGRKSLFLSSGFVKAIDGLHPSESATLLDYLNEELAGRPDLQVRFRWSPGAIVVWDNRSTSHFGPIDGPQVKQQRIVHRTTVGGDLPVGPGGFVSRPLAGELFGAISRARAVPWESRGAGSRSARGRLYQAALAWAKTFDSVRTPLAGQLRPPRQGPEGAPDPFH
jgi:alpha-ketoglutarate-dependent sulfate ester dioxygenase